MNTRYDLNKIIHEPARLMILTFLASSPEKERSFSEIREHLQLSAGNLSVQLKNLQDAGLLHVQKRFEEGKPLTTVEISRTGIEMLMDYLEEMERLILWVRKGEEK